jgi:hypothetical protein
MYCRRLFGIFTADTLYNLYMLIKMGGGEQKERKNKIERREKDVRSVAFLYIAVYKVCY